MFVLVVYAFEAEIALTLRSRCQQTIHFNMIDMRFAAACRGAL